MEAHTQMGTMVRWLGERLIDLTKTVVRKVLGRSYVSYQTLQTVVTEAEAMINVNDYRMRGRPGPR